MSQAAQILGGAPEKNFDCAAISIASPEIMRSWSHGEVKNPETINYRTFKPEKGGLFCERIFGPQKDWECACGKYKRIKHKGVICDRCGVEVTLARVRRERMGHIDLAVPVSHIWFFKCTPTRMGLVLDMAARQLERVLYYEDYLCIDPGDTPLKEKQLLNEMEYREARQEFGDKFVAKMGAEGVRDMLGQVDLQAELEIIEEAMGNTRSKQIRTKLTKRMKTIQALLDTATHPEWMVLEVLPVIPPDLRPLVPLDGGKFATSDLNDLYRRVINRNNRLKNLLSLKTPDVIIRNEKRMLQEAVDALLDNGRHGRAVTGPGNRPLKSLSDMLKGKQGRFRQNLLGKRVDYSGRSVIVIGPDLKIHQCGLPKKMALVLFEPFIIRRLKELGIVHTVRSAKKMIEREADEVWDILEEVTKGHTVLLNRAPTLHRLSIQSFEPKLIEGEAIRVHPLVCTAYNADFDGDQMAVHVPLSIEAQLESRLLMLASNNIFSPSSGKPVTTPTQDIALGCYYITSDSQKVRIRKRKGEELEKHLPMLCDVDEVHTAHDEGVFGLHDRIRLRNPDYGREELKGTPAGDDSTIVTTVGRVFFNEIWPKECVFCNTTVTKKRLERLIWDCYKSSGHEETVHMLDRLKVLGFEYAMRSGISGGIADMIIPDEKAKFVGEANEEVSKIEGQYSSGIITARERYGRIVDCWTHATEQISEVMMRTLEYNNGQNHLNPIFMMVDSGARGSKQQIRQLAGMRGLMAKPSGEIIERPILSNFREGLSVLEYFISTHGARKGLADTALKTADSGYLTRKLVDVAHDIIIGELDCGTLNGIEISSIREGDNELVPLSQRILGRSATDDIIDPQTKKPIVKAGEYIREEAAAHIAKLQFERMRIRSVLTCEAEVGVCARCYGLNPALGDEVALGESVGIIAAQSIGEPGTQLTMRTFHVGGVATVLKQPEMKAKNSGVIRYPEIRTVQNEDGQFVVLSKNGTIGLYGDDGKELERYNSVVGMTLQIADGTKVKKGTKIGEWDQHNVPVIAETAGVVKFNDFIEGVTYKNDIDENSGHREMVIMEHKEDLHPQILITDPKSGETLSWYAIPAGAHVDVVEKEEVQPGKMLAKTPRKVAKTKDITGGLPRVAELFEARRPKDACEIAKIDGIIELRGTVRGKRKLVITDETSGEEEEHLIPMGAHLIALEGEFVHKGDQLTEGSVPPQELLEISGPQELQEYLVNEVQSVYRLQGVEINDKHIEIIVRQMLRKVKITDPGDTNFLWSEQVERTHFQEENIRANDEGRRPAEATPVLLGITKAALETESFISAASFQDTTRVLTDAASMGKIDELRGFKENVIMGHLIPAGTGFSLYRNIRLKHLAEPLTAEELYGEGFLEEKKPSES